MRIIKNRKTGRMQNKIGNIIIRKLILVTLTILQAHSASTSSATRTRILYKKNNSHQLFNISLLLLLLKLLT